MVFDQKLIFAAANDMIQIDPELVKSLRTYAVHAEALKQLHPEQLKIIYEQKWFKLFVPKSHGGLELSLPEALRLEETLAWIDGSLGWTVTLCGGAGWFIGFMSPELISIAFNDPKVCLGGSGRAFGVAKAIGDEYEITGCWPHNTGSAHLTAFTANCVIEGEDNLIRPFLFLRNEVKIIPTWKYIGMIATSSESFEVKNLRVHKNRMFFIDPGNVYIKSPIYELPFNLLAETTLAVNCSGMALRFVELCEEIAELRNSEILRANLKVEKMKLDEAREQFYKDLALSYNLASVAREVMDKLYPLCGLHAADPSTEINRIWRDMHTASQHPHLNPSHI